jgi:hypothetical protein
VHDLDKVAEDLVAHLLVAVLIVLNQVAVAHHVLVVLAQEDRGNVLVALLEKAAAKRKITRARRLVAKRSTIWRRQQLVAQSFRVVMEVLRFDFDAALRWQISLRKSAQIPQRLSQFSSI